ncbi:uncharacterized protein LOC117106142 [Anneissia japonica]|uniref:uncharacterized protein LOC117106142 n=1 Tax=Anneissia japonica TaxID=1529436 RepID=UPI0014256298|nr:uncharacterized protein LOC117106142 [Anneissia japonica]
MSILKQSIVIAITAVAVLYLPGLWKKKLPVIFEGQVEKGFEAVFDAFKMCIRDRYTGKKVVDIWGGYADKQSHRPWKQDTLATIYSSGKGVAAICIGMLIDRGLLKYDDKVVKYWPEFGKHGKQDVTVEMLLSHQGIVSVTDIDIHFGLHKEKFHRLTRMEDTEYTSSQYIEILQSPSMRSMIFGSLIGRESIWNNALANVEELLNPYLLNDPDNRLVEVPSAFGVGTAEGLAKLYGILANGGEVNGKKIMSKRAIEILNTGVSKGFDKTIEIDVEWGPGTGISNIQIGKAFGHSGAGGQEAWANPELKLGYGFVTNTPTLSLLESGKRYLSLRNSVYDCVQKLGK